MIRLARRLATWWWRRTKAIRPTRDGWWCVFAAVGLGVAAVNTGNNLAYLLCSMLLALIIVSGMLSDLTIRGLHVTVTVPDAIHATQPALVTIVLANRKRRLASYSVALEALDRPLPRRSGLFARWRPRWTLDDRLRAIGLKDRRGLGTPRRLAYVPGDLNLWPSLTGEETLALLGRVHGRVDPAYRDELIARFDFDPSKKVRSYSKGNRQKISLIAALMTRAELLILDEPTSGLDPLMQQEFLELVRESRAAGQTIFMSSHVLAEVQHAADRVGIVRDGHLVAVERVESLGKRAKRHVEIHFDGPVPAADFEGLPGVTELQVDGAIVRCTVDGMLDPLIKAAARHRVADLISTEPDLEETFLSYYYTQEGDRHGA